jgi:WD40 repeat protein
MSKIRHVWILLCLILVFLTTSLGVSAQTDTPQLLYDGGEDFPRSVAFSPDGQHIAVGTMNGHTLILDSQTGEEVLSVDTRDASVTAVLFTSDGNLWSNTAPQVEGGDYALRLYDLQNSEVVRVISGEGIIPYAITISPDNHYLFYATNLSQGNLRDIEDSAVVRAFVGHTAIIWDAAFSPDGHYLLTGSEDEENAIDNTARLWDVETGQEIRRFEGHTNGIRSVAFSPNGQAVLTGSGDSTVRLWNTETAELIHTFEGHTDLVNNVAFSPDGQFIITGSWDGTVRVWNIETGEETQRFEGEWVSTVAVSPDGTSVVIGAGDGTLRLWQFSS